MLAQSRPATQPLGDPPLGGDDLRPAGIELPTRRESLVELGFGAGLVIVAAALALAFPGHLSLVRAFVLVATYAAVSRVIFYAGVAYTSPTQLVFVPMLFAGAAGAVPLLVLLGGLAAGGPELTRARWRPDRIALVAADAWYAVPPAVVLLALGIEAPGWEHWPVLLLAFAAQLLVGNAIWVLRTWLDRGVGGEVQVTALVWLSGVDACLSAIGLLAASRGGYTFLLVLPLAWLMAVFARERNTRIDQAVELSGAYRGTALLLGDLLEHADGYTGGEHTHGVVDLATRVAGELGLDEREQRNVEFAALLHDVGKIVIPDAIINKPGKLSAEEWAVIKNHTIAGQQMLDRVGGPLRDVGQIVRASHERWDGGGYPDGLSADEIPREAAVVAVCDAFSAMTTNRSYRRARSTEAALAELRRCAGSQFDPDVVDAAGRVIDAPAGRRSPEAVAAQALGSALLVPSANVAARS